MDSGRKYKLPNNMAPLPTITIGIPAYNEEANIGHLLSDLLKQRGHGFLIERILVMSDGSSDETVSRARSLDDDRIVVLEDHLRKGKSLRQNDIIDRATSDILVFLDADIIISDCYFIDRLIRPLLREEADLVSGTLLEVTPENFLEKMLFASMEFKRLVFRLFRGGDNMYNCVGPVRAFRRRLYQTIRFRPNIADDMYTYLFCTNNGFTFAFVPEAVVHYQLPGTLSDYFKQSFRYNDYLGKTHEHFSQDFIVRHTRVPFVIYLVAGMVTLVKYPISFPGYIGLKVMTRVVYLVSRRSHADTWETVQTSKVLRRIV